MVIEEKAVQAVATPDETPCYMVVYTHTNEVFLLRLEVVKAIIDALLAPILVGDDPMMSMLRLGLKGLIKPHVKGIVRRIYEQLLHQDAPDIPRLSDPLVVLTDTAKRVLLHYLTLHEWELHHEYLDARGELRIYEVRGVTPYTPVTTIEGDGRAAQ